VAAASSSSLIRIRDPAPAAVGNEISSSTHLLYQSKISISSRVSCKHTGITGPTGAVAVYI
jgi:hypothetical protein